MDANQGRPRLNIDLHVFVYGLTEATPIAIYCPAGEQSKYHLNELENKINCYTCR